MMMLLFSISMLLVLAGLTVGAAVLLTRRSSPVESLKDRLARGEVTPDEYRERLELLAAEPRGSSRDGLLPP